MFATRFSLEAEPRYKNNNGQQAEREVRYYFNNVWESADNRKGGTDVRNAQIKSFRATLCHGADLEQMFVEYAEAECFIFADREEQMFYTMSKAEFMEFAKLFVEVTKESAKNGGATKCRLNRQYRQQREWLRDRT